MSCGVLEVVFWGLRFDSLFLCVTSAYVVAWYYLKKKKEDLGENALTRKLTSGHEVDGGPTRKK